jgi:predicted phage tail protein
LFGFGDSIAQEQSVSSEVKWDGSSTNIGVTRTLNVNNIPDEIKIKLSFQMQQQDPSNGNVNATDIRFGIYLQQNLGSFDLKVDQTISGRYSSPTEFDYRIRLPKTQVTQLAIKILKLTVDNTETEKNGYQRSMSWVSYSNIVYKRLNYPNTALAAFSFDTSGFSSVPNVVFNVYGRLVQIPSNGTIDGVIDE